MFVVGHSGAVVTPAGSDRSAAAARGDAGQKPATEPPGVGVTARRRSVVLAGYVGDRSSARAGLADHAAAVRASAYGALDRLGALTEADLRAALADPAPSVRRRGCELATPFKAVDVSARLEDDDPSVVEMAAWVCGERGDTSSVPALAALATVTSGHADPLCRESAVAAIGAIGDRAGLSAVLAALDDKPAIRRRAAVALAAFEGPEVDAALRRCLEDRDWQVRQVAEDLLALG
jgi:HEAT repeat protein